VLLTQLAAVQQQQQAAQKPPQIALPPVGTDAARVLKDSLTTLPRTAERWVVDAVAAFVRLLPRILVAIVAAAVVILVALWLRGRLRRHGPADKQNVGVLGILVAATVAALILGATKVAAAGITLAIFMGAATAVQLIGARVFARSQVSPEAVDLVIAVVRAALLTLGVVEALAAIGLNLGGVIAGLGIVGLAFGFAAQDTLANLIAGFTILWDRPLRVGDWIRVGDGPIVGRVAHLTLRTTRLETLQDGLLIIPNKDITGSRLYNLSHGHGATVRLAVSIPAGTDLERARTLLHDLAPDRSPDIVVTAASDASITFEVKLLEPDLGATRTLRSSLIERALAAFRGADIKVSDIKPVA
jgi:small-conductance mechanosensitive channel